MIQVELRILAGESKKFEVSEGTTCFGFLEMVGIDADKALAVLLNGRDAEAGKVLHQGDVVSVFPPVAGG